MDEAAFHAQRQFSNPQPCVFEKAVLAGCAHCRLVQRISLAEREVVACGHAVAHINCRTLVALLRERATFVLHLPPPALALGHAQAMQIQCGGLRGLQAVMGAAEMDVHVLVLAAQQQMGSLLHLPWPELLAHVRAYTPRRRSGQPRR